MTLPGRVEPGCRLDKTGLFVGQVSGAVGHEEKDVPVQTNLKWETADLKNE
jgi:hypothetical protein